MGIACLSMLCNGVTQEDDTKLLSGLRSNSPKNTQNENRFFLNLTSSNEDRKTDAAIMETARKMRQADSTDEKKDLENSLRDLLSKDYDNRLDTYDDYLNGLEKQLEEMRAKLQLRRDAKSKMIDLRVKVLEAEADDLGWPSRVSKNRFPTWNRPTPSGFTK